MMFQLVLVFLWLKMTALVNTLSAGRLPTEASMFGIIQVDPSQAPSTSHGEAELRGMFAAFQLPSDVRDTEGRLGLVISSVVNHHLRLRWLRVMGKQSPKHREFQFFDLNMAS